MCSASSTTSSRYVSASAAGSKNKLPQCANTIFISFSIGGKRLHRTRIRNSFTCTSHTGQSRYNGAMWLQTHQKLAVVHALEVRALDRGAAAPGHRPRRLFHPVAIALTQTAPVQHKHAMRNSSCGGPVPEVQLVLLYGIKQRHLLTCLHLHLRGAASVLRMNPADGTHAPRLRAPGTVEPGPSSAPSRRPCLRQVACLPPQRRAGRCMSACQPRRHATPAMQAQRVAGQ